MKLLVVAATEGEIAPFIEAGYPVDLAVTGVGIPSTIIQVSKKLQEQTYDLAIQAGIAGTFIASLEQESCVLVEQDTFADIGAEEQGVFQTIFEMGLADKNEFPYKDGWLKNEHPFLKQRMLPMVSAITVNKITDNATVTANTYSKFHPAVESMEGAAFHYVCLCNHVPFLQLRSISNIVGERDKKKWKMYEAINSLNTALKKITENFI
ncbi:MAG: futalosine hydrolase [Ginsengibacter sp.]